MTKTAKPKHSGTAETLRQALNEAVGNLPALFLEQQISKKLKLQGVKAPKGFSRQIAEHVLSCSAEPFVSPRAARGKQLDLAINDADLEEVIRGLERFYEEQLPALLPSMAGKIAKNVLRNLKSRWPDEKGLQETHNLNINDVTPLNASI